MYALLVTAILAMVEGGVRDVVSSIAKVAAANATKPIESRVKGDALSDQYIRAACSSGQSAKSVLLGLAYSLEPTSVIAQNPFASDLFKDVESDEGRKARLKVMGKPTLRGRDDWLSHFVVSAGLAVIVGDDAANAVGIQKEVTDANTKETGDGSGFSFADLSADFAGVIFARWLLRDPAGLSLAFCGTSFEGALFVPDADGLAEGLSLTAFETKWGGVKDQRFRVECDRLRERIKACGGYQAKRV